MTPIVSVISTKESSSVVEYAKVHHCGRYILGWEHHTTQTGVVSCINYVIT
jgi:hypothetical protein